MKTKLIFLILFSLFAGTQLIAQKHAKKIKISGVVTDKNGLQVEGASIFVDFKNSGTVTNKKGFYKIKVGNESKVISVASASGSLQEEQINGQTVINFTLPIDFISESEQALNKNNKDQINIGYGTINKNDLSTSVNKIDGTGTQYLGYKSIYDMISTQPGVSVNGQKIIIRGIATIYGSTDPLFIVDGNIIDSIENIRPQEVKSIEILKGASSAIYGSRGANGVILITLKK